MISVEDKIALDNLIKRINSYNLLDSNSNKD